MESTTGAEDANCRYSDRPQEFRLPRESARHGCRLLISLLNAVLRYPPGRRIRKLAILPRHVTGPVADDKEVVLDVRAEAEDGRQFHIEVQVCTRPAYAERALFYWAGLYRDQLEVGQGYEDLRAAVSVHFLFFRLLPDSPEDAAYHHVFRVRADATDGNGPVLSPHFELHTVEMTRFPDVKEGAEDVKWVYWLKHGQEMTEQEVEKLGVPEIVEAERKLAMISQDRSMRVEYEMRMKARRDAETRERDFTLAGMREGVIRGILSVCKLLGLEVSAERRTWLEALHLTELEALQDQLAERRAWPAD